MKNFQCSLYIILFLLFSAGSVFSGPFRKGFSPRQFSVNSEEVFLSTSSPVIGENEVLEFSGLLNASLNVTFPSSGIFLCPGTTVSVQWLQNQLLLVDIEFSSDGGASWIPLQTSFSANLQQYQWTVPSVNSTQCLIRLNDAQGSGTTGSSGLFSIGFPSFISPNGGEVLAGNNPYQITWNGFLHTPSSLEFSSDNGASWLQLASGVTGNSFFWDPVSLIQSSQCLLRLSDSSSGNVLDVTDTIFSIDNVIAGTNTIITDSVVGTMCRKDTVRVYFSTSGIYPSGNQFIAQISDVNGLFVNPTNIGAISGQTSGVIHAIIPDNLANGTSYYIRVRSTNQPIIGSPYLIPLQLSGTTIDFSAPQTFRVLPNDGNVLLNFIGQSSSVQSFSWDFGNGGTSNTANTSHNYTAPGFYDITLSISDASGCVQQLTKHDYIQVEVQFPAEPVILGSSANALAVDFIDTLKGCFAMSDGTCRITTDGGQTFTGSVTGAPGALKSASIVPGQWMVAGEQGFVATSANLGASWTPFSLNYQGTIHSVSMSSSIRGLMVGDNGAAFYFDSIAWFPISTNTTNHLFSVIYDGIKAFVCGDNGCILKYTPASVVTLNSGTGESLRGIYFSGTTVYAVGPEGMVLKSTDDGNTFSVILGGLDTDLNAITGSGSDTIWVFGTKGIILQSFDGGNTWDRYTNGTLNDNNGGNYKAARRRGATAGDSGNALVFGSGGAGSFVKDQFRSTLRIFPNPANDQLFLQFDNAGYRVVCRVFDAAGREYRIPTFSNFNGLLSMDVSSLASGTYFVEANLGTERKIGRFVIDK
jgi:photosystem II stability/assembly factor-like uncharacterized protein